MWAEGTGFGYLYDYLRFRGHTDIGNMDDAYMPLDVSGNGRIIVGKTGALSGLPGRVAVTVHE